jgi:hypothetical protein
MNCTSANTSLSSTFCRALGKEKLPSRRQVMVTELCRAFAILALDKEGSSGPPLPVPLSRAPIGTRQSELLCGVPDGWALDKRGSSGHLC